MRGTTDKRREQKKEEKKMMKKREMGKYRMHRIRIEGRLVCSLLTYLEINVDKDIKGSILVWTLNNSCACFLVGQSTACN